MVDITHPNALEQTRAVEQTLEEIKAEHIPSILVLNKIDQLTQPEDLKTIMHNFPNAVAISALKGTGFSELLKKIELELFENFVEMSVQIPYTEGQLISLYHEQGHVQRVEHFRKGVFIQGQLPVRLVARFSNFIRSEPEPENEVSLED